MPPRPHDILSPASNASNVRPPTVLPSEVDHVTWKSISKSGNRDLLIEYSAPGSGRGPRNTQQIRSSIMCPCSQEPVLTQDPPWSSPNDWRISQGRLTSTVQQILDSEACPGTPYRLLHRLWSAMTTHAMQSSHIKHQAVTNVLNERRNDPAHENSTPGHKLGFQRLYWGPFVISPLWRKWPLTNATHLLVTHRARELLKRKADR